MNTFEERKIMPLSWNEIKDRALSFSKEWADESSEDAEARASGTVFNIFGITRRRIASFEMPVKKSDGKDGYIDLLWKGVLLVEHKSRGKNLDRAFHQAVDYFPGLKERDLPRYVLVSDFAKFRLYDLDLNETHEFPIEDLYKKVRLFGFVAGYQTRSFGQEDPVNVEAAERLAASRPAERRWLRGARTGSASRPPPLLSFCRGYGDFRAPAVPRISRAAYD